MIRRLVVGCLSLKVGGITPAELLDAACSSIGGGVILAYHSPLEAVFEAQILALRNYDIVPLSEIVERRRVGRSTSRLLAITVDDGVGEAVRAVRRVCLRHEWPATFFLPTGYLDTGRVPFQRLQELCSSMPLGVYDTPEGPLRVDTPHVRKRVLRELEHRLYVESRSVYEEYLNALWTRAQGIRGAQGLSPMTTPAPIRWEEARELAGSALFEVGSHTINHEALSALGAADLEAELGGSKRRLEEQLDREVRFFCYPYGDRRSIGVGTGEYVARHYEAAVTMKRGRVDRHGVMDLPRIPLYPGDGSKETLAKVITT